MYSKGSAERHYTYIIKTSQECRGYTRQSVTISLALVASGLCLQCQQFVVGVPCKLETGGFFVCAD